MDERQNIAPITETIPDERQKWARYYGVHPYFTRRSATVIRAYIQRFSHEGDVVLDPFGGSGVTAIEAFLLGRHGIQNDLNPFANFMAQVIADTRLETVRPLQDAFERVAGACASILIDLQTASIQKVKRILRDVPLPKNIPLPRNSDAKHYYDLFMPQQLAALAILKQAIECEAREEARQPLLLAWSASAAKLNRTFISTKGRAESRGGSSIFSIYRYKVAKTPVELPLWETFRGRYLNVLAAKQEVLKLRDLHRLTRKSAWDLNSQEHFQVLTEDASRLKNTVKPESVDYIFTDPPYGAFIAYLDLSILWNHWLGFRVTKKSRENEIIVGGDLRLSEDHYKARLTESIRASVELLKPDRWISVVFQHWDVSYFECILQAATAAGAELKTAVTQEREVIWSMHKKKNAENVLSGEMILTFYKPTPTRRRTTQVKESPSRLFTQLLEDILKIETAVEFTSQHLFNKLVLRAWAEQSLAQLAVSRREFITALQARGWSYDAQAHLWRRARKADNQLALWG